jgi:hypothetical protein
MYAAALPFHAAVKEQKTKKRTRKKNQSRLQTNIVLFGCLGDVGMFISRVGIITLSFARGRAWGRLFFAPVSVGNMIKGKKREKNIAAQ